MLQLRCLLSCNALHANGNIIVWNLRAISICKQLLIVLKGDNCKNNYKQKRSLKQCNGV